MSHTVLMRAEAAVPTPPAGHATIFVDAAGAIKVKLPDGSILAVGSGGGGASEIVELVAQQETPPTPEAGIVTIFAKNEGEGGPNIYFGYEFGYELQVTSGNGLNVIFPEPPPQNDVWWGDSHIATAVWQLNASQSGIDSASSGPDLSQFTLGAFSGMDISIPLRVELFGITGADEAVALIMTGAIHVTAYNTHRCSAFATMIEGPIEVVELVYNPTSGRAELTLTNTSSSVLWARGVFALGQPESTPIGSSPP